MSGAEVFGSVPDALGEQLTAEEIALLDASAADLDVDSECYQSWRPRG